MARPIEIPKRVNGTGTVTPGKRPGTWVLLWPREPGRPKRQRTVECSERDAHHKLDEWLKQGDAPAPSIPTLRRCLEQHRDEYLPGNVAESTRGNQEACIAIVLADRGLPFDRPITDVSIDDVQSWVNRLFDAGMSRSTIKNYRQPLVTMLNQPALAKLTRGMNVAALTKIPKNAPSKPREIVWLDIEQAKAFLTRCAHPDETWGPYFAVCGYIGARPGEALAIKRQNVLLDESTVHIRQAVKRYKDRPVELGPLKTAKAGREHEAWRTIRPLPDGAVHAFKRQFEMLEHYEIEAADDRWADLIFLRDAGVPPFQSSIRKALDALVERANLELIANGSKLEIPAITPYSLRHTCASIFLDQGQDPHHVARMLGTSVEMLRQHYRHYFRDDDGGMTAGVWNNL